jgi:hypothetical protein
VLDEVPPRVLRALQQRYVAVQDAIAGAIAVDKNSWSALQIGPAMPVAWIDDLGANESIGFPL